MNHPTRAIVVPRVISPSSGESLPIEDVVLAYALSPCRTIRLTGRGKTTALQHLAHTIGEDDGILLLDDQTMMEPSKYPDAKLVVFHATSGFKADVNLAISPWTRDDVIEFLLAEHRDCCKSVMARLNSANDDWLADGDPRVWSMVLPQMANDEKISSVEQAIRQSLTHLLPDVVRSEFVADICFEQLESSEVLEAYFRTQEPFLDAGLFKLLECQAVRLILVADRICSLIKDRNSLEFFQRPWPGRLYELVSGNITSGMQGLLSPELLWLNQIANLRRNQAACVAASLMLKIDAAWKPDSRGPLWYAHARLPGARWPNVNLAQAELRSSLLIESDLRGANLSGASPTGANMTACDLTDADLSEAHFRRADLSRAKLQRVNARNARFTHADLRLSNVSYAKLENADFSGANLASADFRNAYLRQAAMTGAILDGTDFSAADFEGAILQGLDFAETCLDYASFSKANVTRANFENTRIRNAGFIKANCQHSLFTASQFINVDLSGCNLSFAGLADVNWEGCNLAGADFSRASCHLGSTRCGLVGSPFPSHGTRTGFYTDEYDDHYFRRPEEIRKANLCDCDLTGAKVLDADFYLVDLRHARFDRFQRQHFQSCGAILS